MGMRGGADADAMRASGDGACTVHVCGQMPCSIVHV